MNILFHSAGLFVHNSLWLCQHFTFHFVMWTAYHMLYSPLTNLCSKNTVGLPPHSQTISQEEDGD